MEVLEFDPLPPGEEIISPSKARFPRAIPPAKLWCDLIERRIARSSATYARTFTAAAPP